MRSAIEVETAKFSIVFMLRLRFWKLRLSSVASFGVFTFSDSIEQRLIDPKEEGEPFLSRRVGEFIFGYASL